MYVLQAALYSKYGMERITYRCRFDTEEVQEGDTLDLIEEIENHGILPLPWVRSEYSVPAALEFAGTHSTVTGETRFVSSLFLLRGRSRLQRRWHVHALRRGEYAVERVLLVTSDLFGSARTSRPADDLGSVLTVLPVCYEGEEPMLLAQKTAYGESPFPHSYLTDPVTMAGLREYTGYEPVRRIDWNAAAKTGVLMVRQEEPVQISRICVCFTAQLGEYGRRYVSREAAEHTIRVTAALFRELTVQGQAFSVRSNCLVHGEPVRFPECSSAEGYHALLQSLAALELDPPHSLRHAELPADARLIVVTPFLSEDIRRIRTEHPGAEVVLTSPCGTDEPADSYIAVYEDAERSAS